jgi:hypothetical protein
MSYLQIALLLAMLAATNLAVAEVYESRDAEGNPVFSDTPSEGSQKVKLPEANVADAIDVPARPAKAEPVVAAPPAAAMEAPPEINRDIIVRDNDVDRRHVGDRPGVNPPVARPTPRVRPAHGRR